MKVVWIAAGFILIGVFIHSVSGSDDPSVGELRQAGYVNCSQFQDSLGPQVVDSSVKCIEGGKLIEFEDSQYKVG